MVTLSSLVTVVLVLGGLVIVGKGLIRLSSAAGMSENDPIMRKFFTPDEILEVAAEARRTAWSMIAGGVLAILFAFVAPWASEAVSAMVVPHA